jgi:hypothetical protein
VNYPTQYRLITVSNIDLSDNRYTLNPLPATGSVEALRADISTYGLLHPPLLLEQNDNKFIVLSGRKRVQIAAENSNISITALVIDQCNSDQQQLIFSTLLKHQLIGAPLSIIEQAVFFKKAMACLPKKNVLEFLPLMGYKSKPYIPDELICLLELAPAARQGLHSGAISLRTGKKLLLFPLADQQKLAGLINELQLGGSKQQKLVEQTFELSKRQRISAEKILNNWLKEKKDKQHNGPQKAASLLKWLQLQCSPRSAAAEDDFAKYRRQLHLPAGVRLDHTLSFEDAQVTLSINFRSKEQLAKQWLQLRTLLQDMSKS